MTEELQPSSTATATPAPEKPIDLSAEREARIVPLTENILKLMLEADFKLEDYEYLTMKLKASIDMAVNAAEAHLFGKEIYKLTFKDIDNILKQIPSATDGTQK